MKKTIITLILASVGFNAASAQSFVDWANSGHTSGALTATAAWAGYGSVDVVLSGTPGATFLSSTGVAYPQVQTSQSNLEPYGANMTAAKAFTWLTGGVAGVDTSTSTFTFSGGVFPSESVLYITDNDVEVVTIEAFLGGASVDVSDWFSGSVQTRSDGFGIGPGWDPATSTSTLSGFGNEEFFVQEFIPTSDFDTLLITNNHPTNGRIGVSIGDVSAVPEPSSVILLGLGTLALGSRRKR